MLTDGIAGGMKFNIEQIKSFEDLAMGEKSDFFMLTKFNIQHIVLEKLRKTQYIEC